MKLEVVNNGEVVGIAVDIGGTLHVHYFGKRLTYTYKFGEWPKGVRRKKENK